MKKLFLFNFFILFISFVVVNCSNIDKSGGGGINADTGSFLTAHDRLSGVVQAARGIHLKSLGMLIMEKFISDSYSIESFKIPDNSSILRFKLQSLPYVNLTKNGIVHFITEYEDIHNLFHRGSYGGKQGPAYIELELDRIEALPAGITGNEKKSGVILVGLSSEDRKVILKRDRHYVPIIRNGILPAGEYKSITAYFKKNGKISFDGENEFSLTINHSKLSYAKPFTVISGKITTLHCVPVAEYSAYLARVKKRSFLKPASVSYIPSPDHRHLYNQNQRFNLQFNIQESGATIGGRVKEIYISMKSISAVDGNGQTILLNDTPTTFELMSLLDGAVALLGHNTVPAGLYSSFEIVLGLSHTVMIEDEPFPLTIEFEEQYLLNLMGPFDLRGGRITEVFLEFDPDRSVFYLDNVGYVLVPSIKAASVVSMTAEQDIRFIESLGQRTNLVASEAEVMIQANVGRFEYILDRNKYGNFTIYTDMDLNVEDRLRGDPGEIMPFKSIGGIYGGMQLKVTGMPEFKKEDRFIIFLKKYGDQYGIVRGEWGKVDL